MSNYPSHSTSTINYFLGLIVLSIVIPIEMQLKYNSFKILDFLFWLTPPCIILVSILDLYLKWQTWSGNHQAHSSNHRLRKIFVVFKAISGFALIIIFLTSVIQAISSQFSYNYQFPLQLFIPVGILLVIGIMFLRDEETSQWIESRSRWLFPRVKKVIISSSEWTKSKLTLAGVWVGKRRYLMVLFIVIILAASLLPILIKPPEIFPKTLHLSSVSDSLIVDHDYNQSLTFSVDNTGTEEQEVFLRAINLNDQDSLLIGFIGEGSAFESIRSSIISSNFSKQFKLIVHAANARLSQYKVLVQLFEYLPENDADSIKLIEDKIVEIIVRTTPLELEFVKISEDPTTLGQVYRIRNLGEGTISDFSLSLDSLLEGKARIHPEITNFRFDVSRPEIQILLEPLLHVGFVSLEGNLIANGGGAFPVTKRVSFKSPAGKKVMLAVARCGSKTHKKGEECINKKDVTGELSSPPAHNGITYEYKPPASAHLTVDTLFDTSPASDLTEEEKPDSMIISICDPSDIGDYHSGVDPKIIAEEMGQFKKCLNDLLEEFSSTGTKAMIRNAINNKVNVILSDIEGKESLTSDEVDKINEHYYDASDTYYLLTSEQVWRQRKSEFVSALLPELGGESNLRLTDEWLKYSNASAPNISYSNHAVHFTWHYRAPTKSGKQYILYSAHDTRGNNINETTILSDSEEYGKWPFVIEREGKLFVAWQGNRYGQPAKIKIRVSLDTGKTWSPTTSIGNSAEESYAPQLAYLNGTLYAIWVEKIGNLASLKAAWSINNGEQFSEPVTLTDEIAPETVAKFDIGDDYLHFIYTRKSEGANQVIYGVKPHHSNDFSAIMRYNLESGESPVVRVVGNQVYMAYTVKSNGTSKIHYRNKNGTNWNSPVVVSKEYQQAESPSICLGEDGKPWIFYHTGIQDEGRVIDNLNFITKGPGQDWSESFRLPSFSGNSRKAFLSIRFKIPWNRSSYGDYDVSILFNGHEVDYLERFVPEGNLLYPINPSWIKPYGKNEVELHAKHFSPAHYLITYDFSLIADMDYVEQYVFAKNQKEADRLLAADPKFNHEYPDLGLYVTKEDTTLLAPQNGEEISLKLDLWNIGQGLSQNAILDIYGGPESLDEESFDDRFLLGQRHFDSILPMEKESLDLPLTYWTGLEKIIIRVRTREKDFDPSNNTHSLTLSGLYIQDPESYYKGTIRIAVFDEPGELSKDVDMKVYKGGYSTPLETSSKNPLIKTMDPGTYDIYVNNRSSNLEQWIRGVNVSGDASATRSSQAVSLDILAQQIEKTIEPLKLDTVGNQFKFQLPSSILFFSGEYEINTYSMEYLKRIKVLMGAYPLSSLIIEGHTDNTGNPEQNLILSKKRAESVMQWLVEVEGVNKNRLKVIGYGDRSPVASNNTPEGQSKNRRVSFILNKN